MPEIPSQPLPKPRPKPVGLMLSEEDMKCRVCGTPMIRQANLNGTTMALEDQRLVCRNPKCGKAYHLEMNQIDGTASAGSETVPLRPVRENLKIVAKQVGEIGP